MSSDNYKGIHHFPVKPPEIRLFDNCIAENTELWNTHFSHDPSIFKDESSGNYYVYSTDVGRLPKWGIQIRCSKDLINFKFLGWALADKIPDEVKEWTNCRGLWAPDIIKVGNEYRLYYAASTFGSQNSVIGLAVSNSPEGPFEPRGIVLKTRKGDPVNAIDPNIIIEEGTGDHYIVYGSFWSGISILMLDKETGLAKEEGFGKRIATRPGYVLGSVEGPYIKYNPKTGYYYLFVSYGSLFSDYNVRVGRSKKVTGPYLDYNGVELTNLSINANDVGLKITTGYRFGESQGWMALGHNSVLNDNGEWFIVHHARPEPTGEYTEKEVLRWPCMHIRRIVWSDDGWPLVNPCMYAGEKLRPVDFSFVTGTYERIRFENSPESLVTVSKKMYINKDNTCLINDSTGDSTGTWKPEDGGDISSLIVQYDGTVEKYKIIPSWDWENKKPTLALTGLDNKGICIWAKKVD